MASEAAAGVRQETSRFDLGGVLAVATAHMLHDTYSAFLYPLLPLLIAKFSLSLAMAGTLTLLVGLPSLLQPLIGYVADRVNPRAFAILAPIVTTTVMSLLGLAPTLSVLVGMLVLVGLSSAFFHAPSPVIISRYAGHRLGLGLSFFTMAGELARTLGPLMIVTAIGWWSLEGSYRLIIPSIAIMAILSFRLMKISFTPASPRRPAFRDVFVQLKPIIFPVIALVTARAFLISSMVTFLPTYMTMKGESLLMAGASLAILEASGVVGVLVGGTLSDLWGRRAVIQIAFLVSPLLLLLFTQINGTLIFPLLVLMGFFTLSTMPVILAAVLELFDDNKASANGLVMAVTFSIGSLTTVTVGFLGDRLGLQTAFMISAGVAFLGVPFVSLLPLRERLAASKARRSNLE